MQVVAVSTPARPAWRWRIVSYAGDFVEESHETFPSIASAVAVGTRRLAEMNIPDHSVPLSPYRSPSHRHGR